MKKKFKYQQYDALRKALTRDGIEAPGRVARLLFEAFVDDECRISANELEDRKICSRFRGDFADWRKNMINSGWITHSKEFGYQSGRALLKYVNDEKIAGRELATKKDVRKVERKADMKYLELRQEVDVLKKAVEGLIEEYDPPVTRTKVQRALTAVKGGKDH